VRALMALATASAVLLVAAATPAFGAYRYVTQWGHLGKGAGEFGSGILGGGANRQYDDPAGIAIAGNGTVLVVDTSNNRVQRFTPEGRYLGQFGRRGRDNGFVRVTLTNRFFQPEGIAVDRAGSIYVVDSGNDRIMKFNPSGRFRKRLAKHGSWRGEVVQPWGIAVAGRTAFVVDQGNYEVDRLGTGGGFRGSFGTFGRAPGQFVTPYGIAATPAGDRLYVTDLIRHVVMVFSPRGQLLGEFGGVGNGPGQFLKPAGVAVGPDGSVYVADRCNYRVQRFTADGQFRESFGEGLLAAPTFLTLDRGGDVYVSDYHRVVKFGAAAGAARRASVPARAAHHNDIDIWCRHVAEMNGVRDPRG
jgi:tripartite motif-containing protein 71